MTEAAFEGENVNSKKKKIDMIYWYATYIQKPVWILVFIIIGGPGVLRNEGMIHENTNKQKSTSTQKTTKSSSHKGSSDRVRNEGPGEVWMMGGGDILFTYSIKGGGGQNGKMNIRRARGKNICYIMYNL